MLEDSVRNEAYRRAIMDNVDQIRNKVVLDVGSGTGILSIYCAQAGASKVYAVEASETYKLAKEIVTENGFENVIEVIHSRIEDVVLEGDLKVDVLVSEWMGFYLLHEGMLDSVIYARDKFLKPEGLMFPENATIYVAPCSVPDMYENWSNKDGVSMKSFAKQLRLKASRKPETTIIPFGNLLSLPDTLFWFDLKEIKSNELNLVSAKHIFPCSKNGRFQGICVWFTCTFPSQITEPVILSTDPDDPPTHWKQTTIVLPEETEIEENEPVAIEVVLKRAPDNRRRYNIEVTILDPSEIEHPEYCGCHMTKCILAKAVIQRYENNEFGGET